MADITKTIKIEATGLREIKSELDGINQSMDEASDPSKFKALSSEADMLTSKLSQANTELEEVGKKDYSHVSGSLSQIAGGLGAIATAAALAFGGGDDAEEFFKTLATGASITMGVVGGIEAVSGAIKLLGGVTKVQTVLQAALNFVMSANPIMLIVVGIGLLVAAFIAFQEPIMDFINSFKSLGDVIMWLLTPFTNLLKMLGLMEDKEGDLEKVRAENAKKEQKRITAKNIALSKELEAIDEERDAIISAKDDVLKALELEKDTLEANGESTTEVTTKALEAEKAKLEAVLEANRQKIENWVEYYRTEAELSGQSVEDYKEQMKLRGIDLDLLQNKANDLLAENERSVKFAENKITKFLREQHESRANDAKDTMVETIEIMKAEYLSYTEWIKSMDDSITFDDEEESIPEEDDKIIPEKIFLTEKQKLLKEYYDQGKIDKDEFDSYNLASEQDLSDKLRDLKVQEVDGKLGIAQDYANSANELASGIFALSNSFGKQDEVSKEKRAKRQFYVQKALNLSMAAIDGARAITTSLAAAPVAIAAAPNPVGIASLAFAISSTAATMAKIASARYGGGGGGSLSPTAPSGIGAGGSTSTGQQVPNGPTGPNINFNNNGDGSGNNVGAGGGTTIRTEVVISETAITDVQRRVANYTESAQL
jgi:hypothetical protein